MASIAAALASFLAAQALLVGGWGLPGGALQSPATLATVHLLTIGWLTILMFAALRQFVPVITATRPTGDTAALPALVAIVVGLVALVIGFLALGRAGAWASLPWLPAGGSAVVAGVVTLAAIVASNLSAARELPLAGRFVAAGLTSVLLTVALGLTMAVALSRPGIFGGAALGSLLTRGLELHASVGMIGWFTLTAMGVSYKLLAMFTLAPEERGRLGNAAFWLSAGGLAWVAVAGLLSLALAGTPASRSLLPDAQRAGWLVVVAGLATYLVDVARLFRQRRRRTLELNASYARAALACLGLGLVLIGVTTALGFGARAAGPAAYLLIFGWLSGLALTQLYKIVPFLTWIERYGGALGKGPVPRVQDLVDERAARPWFTLYFTFVVLGSAAGLGRLERLWQWTSAGVLVATLGVIVQLWRARHREPDSGRTSRAARRPPVQAATEP